MIDAHHCMYENKIMKSIKIIEGIRKTNRGGKYEESTLYAGMDISQ
jgi:hypothetical protein